MSRDRVIAPFRYRREADFTALRLGRAVLGYLSLMLAIITLAPFRFALTPQHGLTTIWTWQDLVMNVVMFVPFGFVYQLTRPRGADVHWSRVLLLGGALSGAIELLQLFSPTRYTSLLDVATNTGGAVLGAVLFSRLSRRVRGDTAVQSLALELPLMGLVYQLIPLCWLIGLGSEGEPRRLLVLVLVLIAGGILGTVHAAYIRPAQGHARDVAWLLFTSIGWTMLAVIPGLRGPWMLVVEGLALTIATAMLRGIATERLMHDGRAGRFELPTLRLVIPVFTIYLTLSSLWPIEGLGTAFHGTWALAPDGVTLSQPFVYRALEQVAAFTLVGYMGAEYYGRDPRPRSQTITRLVAWTFVTSALLQAARGFHEQYAASGVLFVFTLVAAAFGHWLYLLQREHIRALVKRRTLLESFRKAAGVR